jgi:hypothetical protein
MRYILSCLSQAAAPATVEKAGYAIDLPPIY